jgi:ATP-dependent exoDNAse (exonuclease V) beta subunit
LAPWAAKEAANRIKAHLKEHAVNRPLTPEEIDELVETGKKEHIKKRDDAADLGTRAHKAIDAYIIGEKPEITDDIRPAVEGFHAWQDAHPFRLLMGDTKVASLENKFGGSLDILGETKDGVGIIDLKTSNQVSWDYALQVGAYAIAFEETYGVPVRWAMVLRVSKTKAEFEARPIKDLESAKGVFRVALGFYKVKEIDLI